MLALREHWGWRRGRAYFRVGWRFCIGCACGLAAWRALVERARTASATRFRVGRGMSIVACCGSGAESGWVIASGFGTS